MCRTDARTAIYVTNTNKEQLSLTEAVSAYQEQWQPERGFHRFKKGRLSALPIYFRDEDKIKGLMFLLTIALRVFTLMEFVVRRQLRQSQSSLAGLYDGNPKRSTDRPTAEQMLKAWLFWFLCGNGVYTDSFFSKIVLKVFPGKYFTIL